MSPKPEVCGDEIRCPYTNFTLANVPAGTPRWAESYYFWEAYFQRLELYISKTWQESYDAALEDRGIEK